MYINDKQLNEALAQNAIILKLWLISKINKIDINDIKPKLAGQYNISRDMLYKYRNDTLQWINSLENGEIKETYTDEDLDAIEAAAAEQYKNSISTILTTPEPSEAPEPTKPKTWQETFKSIDLRSDRLKKASKGYTVPEEEEKELTPIPTKPRKFVPIDIAAIGTEDYLPYNDEEELAKLEAEQKRKKELLKMGIVT